MAGREVFVAEIFEVCVKTHFAAAHHLRGYAGDCAHVHGHNWIVEVYVRCRQLNELGIGVDFRDIKQAVQESLVQLDHCDLNALPAFQEVNPTSENIARFIYRELAARLNTEQVRVSKVKVCETPDAGAYYWEE